MPITRWGWRIIEDSGYKTPELSEEKLKLAQLAMFVAEHLETWRQFWDNNHEIPLDFLELFPAEAFFEITGRTPLHLD